MEQLWEPEFINAFTRYDHANSRINSTKFPASDAGNVNDPRLMSQVVRVHVDQWFSAARAVEMPVKCSCANVFLAETLARSRRCTVHNESQVPYFWCYGLRDSWHID
jgi:hypothetical protein